MNRSTIIIALLLVFSLHANAQLPPAIEIIPPNATAYDQLTLVFDPMESCFWSGSLFGLDSIGMHSGIAYGGANWLNIVPFDGTGANGQAPVLYPTGDGKFSITYTPSEFYNAYGLNVTHICAVFNNGTDWTNDGRNWDPLQVDCMDFFIPLDTIRNTLIHIPGDYMTIQEGINAAFNGDTILVEDGTYLENINFKGKSILLASNFIIDGNPDHILNTIIDGSNAAGQDTASVVLFINGEGPESIIQGFTITGGTGTVWEDEHGPGNYYTEGGGILIQAGAPTIKNNIIRNNEAVNAQGYIVSAGGGAIRCGDGNPSILNNIIFENEGRYGGGIVLNYSGAGIKNNIIAYNFGGNDFGGGGVWILDNGVDPIFLENNTIVYNNSSSTGGGIRIWNSTVSVQNNIIRGNTAFQSSQIQGAGQQVNFCNVEGGYPSGVGNIDEDPMFESLNYLLQEGSPCIDAGNPAPGYNDPEDPGNPGNAQYPAMGMLVNDMGAYGGPYSMEFPAVITAIDEPTTTPVMDLNIFPNPCDDRLTLSYQLMNAKTVSINIYSCSGQHLQNLSRQFQQHGTYTIEADLSKLPAGIYLIKLQAGSQSIGRKLLVTK